MNINGQNVSEAMALSEWEKQRQAHQQQVIWSPSNMPATTSVSPTYARGAAGQSSMDYEARRKYFSNVERSPFGFRRRFANTVVTNQGGDNA